MTARMAHHAEVRHTNGVLLWDRLLELQTELFLPHELAFLFANDDWGSAASVLDVGCGNGHYLRRLGGYCPDKQFTGIDCSGAMIAIAAGTARNQNLRFHKADFYEFKPDQRFDVLLLRLVLQHLQGFERTIERAAELVRPGGSIIILEPEPSAFLMVPGAPSLMGLLAGIEAAARSKGTNRAQLTNLRSRLAQVPEWRVRAEHRSVLPAISSAQRAKFQEMFLLWIDIIEQAREIVFRFDQARSEIEAWAASDNAYGQIGFQIVAMSPAPMTDPEARQLDRSLPSTISACGRSI
jgi:SAM-dependent methyltransferase